MLMLEAQARRHRLWFYTPKTLSQHGARVSAKAQRVEDIRRKAGDHVSLGAVEAIDLAAMDVVLLRQDPPFDMAYITTTHVLERIHPKSLVVNDPHHVRNAPEKLFVTLFPELMPPTLITSDKDDILAFRREHKDIVVKPLYGNGGSGVFHLKPDDENLGSLLEVFTQMFREPVIVQRYLPAIRQGDKRIIIVDGKPAGAVSRMPQEGEARANFHAGGAAKKAELNARERDICDAIGPELRRRGLIFVGIDVIGDYLTEINVTSPTGIQEINRLSGTKIEAAIWDAIEDRRGRTPR
jgi:glutathione synthase